MRTSTGNTNVPARIRSARTKSAAMTHPGVPADDGVAAARWVEFRTSLRTRGHARSGDRDAEAADRASDHPPTSPRADRGRKGGPGSGTAIPSAVRSRVPIRSRSATSKDPPSRHQAPLETEQMGGERELTFVKSTYVEIQVKTPPEREGSRELVGAGPLPRVRSARNGTEVGVEARQSPRLRHAGCFILMTRRSFAFARGRTQVARRCKTWRQPTTREEDEPAPLSETRMGRPPPHVHGKGGRRFESVRGLEEAAANVGFARRTCAAAYPPGGRNRTCMW